MNKSMSTNKIIQEDKENLGAGGSTIDNSTLSNLNTTFLDTAVVTDTYDDTKVRELIHKY